MSRSYVNVYKVNVTCTHTYTKVVRLLNIVKLLRSSFITEIRNSGIKNFVTYANRKTVLIPSF